MTYHDVLTFIAWKLNDQGHAQIHVIVHDNVTIFDTKVHLDMSNISTERTFQLIVTRFFSFPKHQNGLLFMKQVQRIYWEMKHLQFTHKVDQIGLPIPEN